LPFVAKLIGGRLLHDRWISGLVSRLVE
jgi:hypothetical protein